MTADYATDILARGSNPQGLEELYQAACRAGEAGAFAAGLAAQYAAAPDNVLLQAWHYRLQAGEAGLAGAGAGAGATAQPGQWPRTLAISAVAGVTFALLSLRAFDLPGMLPLLALLAGPAAAVFMLAYLAGGDEGVRRRAWPAGAAALVVAAYAVAVVVFGASPAYRLLMVLHLPILAVSAVGLGLLGWSSSSRARFAFLLKCVEVVVTGGLFVLAGGVIAMLTLGLFGALGITLPFDLVRVLIAGGGGLITVWSLAMAYDARRGPEAQSFEQGLSRLITSMMRLLLPLVLVILVVYVIAVPFNFMQPFRQREVLFVYNALLFAVMALLLAITPVRADELAGVYRAWLRRGILALAALTLLVSVYALAAIVYRTAIGGLTLNRLAVLGWNLINIGLLALVLYRQLRAGGERWVQALQSVFSDGAYAYVGWTLFLALVAPWLFR